MLAHYIDLGWRSIRRTPMVSTLMTVAIALGIGITMTSLSVYHMMSMDPIPSKSDRLFSVQLQTMDDGNTSRMEDDLPSQVTYQDAMNLLNADLPNKKAAMFRSGFSVYLADSELNPFLSTARLTGGDFFSLFNATFMYGSRWTPEQETSASSVVVLSKAMNDKLFGGSNSVGQLVYLDNEGYQVVGVLNEWNNHIKYYDLTNGAFNDGEDFFLPVTLAKEKEIDTWGNTNGWKYEPGTTFKDKLASERFWLQFWVQLDSEAEKKDYEQFLLSYMQEQQQQGRFNRKTLEYGLKDVNTWLDYFGVVSEDNRVLVGLSFMFLFVCVANILGLLLAKFLRRAPEVGVRRALGASKTQVFLQHIVEVSMLGVFGATLGIVLAQLGLWGVRQSHNYYSALATMDITMYLAAPVISILACILAGIYPAWLVCRTTPATYLKTQ